MKQITVDDIVFESKEKLAEDIISWLQHVLECGDCPKEIRPIKYFK